MKRFILCFIILIFSTTLHAEELTPIRIPHHANIAFTQAYVIKEQGWDKQVGLDVQLRRFPSGPFVLQAFANDELDILYAISSSMLTIKEKGFDLKIIAGSTRDQISVQGVGKINELVEKMPIVQAVKEFQKQEGRNPKVALFARGVWSDVLFREWLARTPELTEDDFDISNIAGQDQLQQTVFSGSFDLASIFEPLITIAKKKGQNLKTVLKPGELMENAPLVVIAAGESYIKDNADIVEKYLRLHIRATEFIKQHPQEAAKALYKYAFRGLMEEADATKVLVDALEQFDADPYKSILPMDTTKDYFLKTELLKNDFNIHEMYDLGIYQKITGVK